MPTVEIYTTRYCPFFNAAKALLKRKGVTYSEIDVSRDWERRNEMIQLSFFIVRKFSRWFHHDQCIQFARNNGHTIELNNTKTKIFPKELNQTVHAIIQRLPISHQITDRR